MHSPLYQSKFGMQIHVIVVGVHEELIIQMKRIVLR